MDYITCTEEEADDADFEYEEDLDLNDDDDDEYFGYQDGDEEDGDPWYVEN